MSLHNHLPLSTLIEHLETTLPSLMKEAQVPGLSLTLIRDAQLVWSGAWGVKQADTQEPVTPQTIFQAASLSKPLFAYAVLLLAQRKEIELDRPLTGYLSTASISNDPLVERVTARMVLSHLTGWPNWREDGQPLVFQHTPGEQYSYSGEGFGYLQQVVEAVTGQPLEVFIRQTVFDPLRMPRSSFVWADVENVENATGHDEQGKPVTPFTMAAPHVAMAAPHAAASLHATPSDYARFLCTLLDSETMQGPLSPVWKEEMLRPHVWLESEIAWGLGWGLQQNRDGWAFWHSGDNPGFKSFTLAYQSQRMGVVIMTNSDNGTTLWKPLLQTCLGGQYPLFAWRARRATTN